MNLNEQLKQNGVNEKFINEVEKLKQSMINSLARNGRTKRSFCDDRLWEHKTRHMRALEEYFRSEGFKVWTEYKYEVWDLYVEIQ